MALGFSWGAAAQPFDRFDEKEDTGIYKRRNQKALDAIAIGTVLGMAAWEGTDTRLGRTAWQAVDASVTAALTTEVLKHAFRRPRPADNHDPNVWFAGSRNRSFPSGEVALITSTVTPFIYQYGPDHPAAYALIALPLYMGNARMKSQAHWLSDVTAGAAIGWATGVWAMRRDSPWVLSVTGHSAWVGLRQKF